MIEKIIESLNHIEVHGKQNLDILLGCILALEQLAKEQKELKENHDEVK